MHKKRKGGPLLSLIFLGLWLGPLQKIASLKRKKGKSNFLSYVPKKKEVIKVIYFFALRRANPALKNNQVGAIVALRSLKTSILSERERES